MKCPCCGAELRCPSCGSTLQNGSVNIFCSNYKSGCNFRVPYFICGKKLSESQLLSLITEQKTKLVKGLLSKNGKKFDAVLRLNLESGKIEFEFPEKER